MQTKDIIAIVIISLLSAIVVAISIVMLVGRGARLIAGYNTLSKDEKEKINSTKLSKFLGKILLPIGLSINGITIGIVCNIQWIGILVAIVVVTLIVIAAVYCNTGNRFEKQ